MIYLIGSLRNEAIPAIASTIRAAGYDVFDDWFAAGPEADDYWRAYEIARGRTMADGLQGHAARHVYGFDRKYLELSNAAVLALPAGKSAHLELGWALGSGRRGYVLYPEEPERWDVMYQFANGIFTSLDDLIPVLWKEVVP